MKSIKKAQQGFTLVEMIVVVAIIGVLASFMIPAFKDMDNPAKAQAMLSTSERFAQNWRQIAKACAVSSAVASNPIPATGKTVSDVVFGGRTNVATAYQNCYDQSQVKPLAEAAEPSGTAGTYNVNGYALTPTGGGTAPLQLALAAVPDELTLLMAQKYNRSLSALAASDSASPIVQYSTVTSGARTVTVIKQ